MPPKFRKSTEYSRVPAHVETEVLDAYAEVLDTTESPDLVLQDLSQLLNALKIPHCFTEDISKCIDWYYATQNSQLARKSVKWAVAEQLLRHVTISSNISGQFDVSDIVDIDKLVMFCNRLLKFRDNFPIILQNWTLFVEASGAKGRNAIDHKLTLQDLIRVKSMLQLDDISDSILIDMLGCARSNVEGDLFTYKFSSGALEIGIKDFAEVLGLLGEYD